MLNQLLPRLVDHTYPGYKLALGLFVVVVFLHTRPHFYAIRYSILIPRRSISSRKVSAGTSRSCKTAPRLLTAPEHIICSTMEAGKAVVRIMALMSLLGS